MSIKQTEALQESVPEPKCTLSQSNGVYAELPNVALTRANDKAGEVRWALVVLTPPVLDIHFPFDFGLIVEEEKAFLTRFRNCNTQGCQVVIFADNSLLTNLKHANNGAILFRLLNGKVIGVGFSLKGFTKAFNAFAFGERPKEQGAAR